MRILVRHESHYLYEPPVKNLVQILRLQPRSHEGQHVIKWRVEVDADCALMCQEDTFGNLTHHFSMSGLPQWTLLIEGEVDTTDMAGVVRGSRERFPVELFLRETTLTPSVPIVQDFSASLASQPRSPLDQLHGLMELVHHQIRGTDEMSHFSRSADEVVAHQQGSVSDRVHVFLACARLLNIPSRFVSGYVGQSAQNPIARLHYWAESFVEGLGWVAFDPVLNICPQEHHVRIAIGLDILSGASIRSAVGAGSLETISANVHIEQHQAQWQS
jgi:transglutaminase-like putative cysteine protease